MIHYMTGSIFDSDCECLVNPVNCVGEMGAGLGCGLGGLDWGFEQLSLVEAA